MDVKSLAKKISFAKKIGAFIKTKVEQLITVVALLITYFVGIGLTSMVARLVGKQFLDSSNKNTLIKTKTTWKKISTNSDLRKMY